MSLFTDNELAFLARHNFTPDDVYDGRHEDKLWRQENARKADKILVLTSVPCAAKGHRIRTRAGHCAQCKPANIGFSRRETQRGYVYIAGSQRGRFIKIGVTSDIEQRERQLRTERYGGSSDWVVLVYNRVNDMQRVEREIASRIIGERVFNGYFKDGRRKIAKEVIRCPFSAALDAYADVTGLVQDKARVQQQWTAYEFT